MAHSGVQLDREAFSCPVCLDLLKDPVTISCGHNYCMNCIKTHWDKEDEKGIYSCPQCRNTIKPRPNLVKNTMLAFLIQELRKTGLQAAPPDHFYARPEDVACDVCTGRKLKACRSCLVCLASYCDKHLQLHSDLDPFKKHKLVEPSTKLQENVCSRHDEVMKMFCRTDQQSICYLCSVDKHKGHDTVSAAAERSERQKELEVSRQSFQQRIKDREKDGKQLQQELEAINCSADKAVEDSEKIFTELIHLIETKSSKVKQQVRSRQGLEVNRVKKLQETLEQEITELKRKDAELERLSRTEDHTQFLHNYTSLSRTRESTDLSSINAVKHPVKDFKDILAAVSEVRDKLQALLIEKSENISQKVTKANVLLSLPQPQNRAEFLKYACDITLDPNTANVQLLLSEGNRRAALTRQRLSYPSDHQDRFIGCWQALGREGLTGRCYWEVTWRGRGVCIAVAYKNTCRTGSWNNCGFGQNDTSWALDCYNNNTNFWYNKVKTPVSVYPLCSRIGVYLDHSAGVLSFYSISSTMTLIHRVQTTFKEPLYAGLWLNNWPSDDTAQFCQLK